MIVKEAIRTIPLRAGDKVVAAVPWQDKVLVITERGKVFALQGEQHD